MKNVGRWCVWMLLMLLCLIVPEAQSQITNGSSLITAGIEDSYNTAAALGIGAIVVGMAVYFIRKGAKLRA